MILAAIDIGIVTATSTVVAMTVISTIAIVIPIATAIVVDVAIPIALWSSLPTRARIFLRSQHAPLTVREPPRQIDGAVAAPLGLRGFVPALSKHNATAHIVGETNVRNQIISQSKYTVNQTATVHSCSRFT